LANAAARKAREIERRDCGREAPIVVTRSSVKF
jgi:hypothetical protein